MRAGRNNSLCMFGVNSIDIDIGTLYYLNEEKLREWHRVNIAVVT